MKIGSLFAGYGGLEMGVTSVLGGEPAWFSEFDKHPSRILAHRYPDVPNHGDITSIDWTSVEPVDVITGGFPCQDVSHAGARRGLKSDTRTGLWSYMRDAIATIRPRLVVAENVRGLLSADADSSVEPCPWCVGDGNAGRPMRALGAVLADLADIGYDAWWCGLRAANIGAPHGRFRVFIFAWPADTAGDPGWFDRGDGGATADATHDGREGDIPRRPAPEGPWTAGNLLRTPTAQLAVNGGSQHPDKRKAGGHGPTLADEVEHLLPTPAVNDMGKAYTPDEWDAWTAKMRVAHGNGNGHGPSLHVEALRMLPTPRALDATGVRGVTGNRSDEANARAGLTLTDAAHLMPTPSVADAMGGHDRRGGSRGDELLLNGMAKAGHLDRYGDYAPAIARWETLTRPAPAPTEPTGKGGAHRLSPAFVEWMMGLPAEWVTDPAIWQDSAEVEGKKARAFKPSTARNAQLKALGNGVVPQQAAEAARRFLAWTQTQRAAA